MDIDPLNDWTKWLSNREKGLAWLELEGGPTRSASYFFFRLWNMQQEVGAAEKREILSPVRRVSFDSPVMAAATKLDQKQIQDILDLHK